MNAEAETSDEASVLAWYKTLARFRQEHPAMIYGSYTEVYEDREDIFAFVRDDGEEKILVVVNFGGEEAVYDVAHFGNGDIEILLSSYPDADGKPEADRLRPYEAVVLRIANEV